MNPEVRVRLGHVLQAIDAIEEFVAGLGFNQYLTSLIHRSAVERQFEIIGEALNTASRLDPRLENEIGDLRDIINLRHRVIHGYEVVDDSVIWATVQTNLPALREQVLAVLG